ncbi:hypothetical protein ROD_48841 [Citrobacter rodentium ICC168]|uniref:Uncharacterized protein n=1 Tax=Citrobacter rodentium (strain ICC168) TaxID=637910 RepID=D2TRX6_CITRI|nr:hypothetical protein ROD_48841 [Citrobacter rodentium ICC168]
MTPNSISNKDYVCIDIPCSLINENIVHISTNRSIRVVDTVNEYTIIRSNSELTLNDLLDDHFSISSSPHISEPGSQLTLNDFLTT